MCQHHIAICIKLFIPEHYVIETPKLSKMSVDFNGNAPQKPQKIERIYALHIIYMITKNPSH